MRVPAARSAALLFLLWSSPVRADVADFLGRPIASVQLQAEGRDVSDAVLVPMIETRPGQPLSLEAVRETVAHLVAVGRFEGVVVHANPAAGGVALRYELIPVHPVTAFEFSGVEGSPGIDEGRLKRVIVDRFGPSPPAARAPDMVDAIRDELRQRGYLRGDVSVRSVVAHAPDHATLAFAVTPGSRTTIGKVSVEGLTGGAAADLIDSLDLRPGGPFLNEAVQERIAEYIEERRRHGHYEARLTIVPRFEGDAAVVNLTVNAALGPRVRVAFTGDPLPAERRSSLVPVAQEGSADEDLLEDATNRIQEFLRTQGYRDAVAPYTRQQEKDDLLIAFHVQRGPQYVVERVDITGNAFIPVSDFQPGLKLQVGQPFADATLEADVAAIEELYRRAGFASVRVTSTVEPSRPRVERGPVPMVVGITIDEQARTVVASVSLAGNSSVPDTVLRPLLGTRAGEPFLLNQLAIDREAIQQHYANLGYQRATVDSDPGLNADGTAANVVFTVREGVQTFIDHVLIVGNTRTRRETIQRELQFKPGDPLGLAAIGESQRRLAALQLFRRTRIQQLRHGDEGMRDLLVTVEEAPVTSVGYGGGLEAGQRIRTQSGVADERIEFAPRAFFEIGRRNLFGKNRSINLFTRVSLRSDPVAEEEPAPPAESGGSAFGFSEYRVLGTFREPRVFGSAADAFLTGTIEQQIRSSFKFSRRAFNAEAVRSLSRTVTLSGNYQIQRTELFDEEFNPADKLLIDRLFPQVRLSSFSASVIRDTRDDPIDPATGLYLSANAQVAGRRIGSEVGLGKTFLTAQAFHPLPGAGRFVLAASARVGLAAGFPRSVTTVSDTGTVVTEVVRELPASERFFAGGDTTVRGFALDQLGTRETIDEDGFPVGGNALVILNAEIRTPLRRGLGLVGFFDTGNVFARTSRIDLGELRSAVGFGIRYRSPVGPIRVDLGFKVNRRDIVPGRPEARSALHISLGQAF